MSRILRFLGALCIAFTCVGAVFLYRNVFAAGSDNTYYVTLNDMGALVPSSPLTYTPASVGTYLTTIPYKPGWAYGGHYASPNCQGGQYITPKGYISQFPRSSGTIWACWRYDYSIHTSRVRLNDYGGSGGKFRTGCGNGMMSVNIDNVGYSLGGRGDWAYYIYPTKAGSGYEIGWHAPCGPASGTDGTFGGEPLLSSLASTPTMSGYTFQGYYTDKDYTTKVINADGSFTSAMMNPNQSWVSATNTTELVAKWAPNGTVGTWRTVTIDDQGATQGALYDAVYMYSDQTGSCTGYRANQSCGATVVTNVGVPVKPGYTFAGYYTTASTGGTQWADYAGYITAGTISSDMTVYARWVPEWFIVTLNGNSGTVGTPAKVCLHYGVEWTQIDNSGTKCTTTPITSAGVPTRSGWSFLGYYTLASGGTQISMGAGTLLTNLAALTSYTSHGTAYAHWTKGSSTERYLMMKLQNVSGSAYSIYEKANMGWYSSTDGLTYNTITNSIFAAIADGGAGLTVPTNSGYTFNGYWTASSGGTQVIRPDGTIISDPTYTTVQTFYAQWLSAQTTTITFNANNGSFANHCSTTTVATYGQPMPVTAACVEAPTRSGWNFNGYADAISGGTLYYDANMSSLRNWDKTSPTATLYAQWVRPINAVSYHCEDGESEFAVDSVEYQGAYTVRQYPTRICTPPSGKIFDYWQVIGDTNNNLPTWTGGQSISSYPYNYTVKAIAHYANASSNYTITYQANGGSGSNQTQSVTSGSTFTTKAGSIFTKTNYVVSSWATVSGGSYPTPNTQYTYNTSGNTTLNAKWAQCKCVEGSNVSSCSVTGVNSNRCQYSYTCNSGYVTSGGGSSGTFQGTVNQGANTSPSCSAPQTVNFNITYASGGGSGSAPSSPTSCTAGSSCTAPSITYTAPTGYVSAGRWECLVTTIPGHSGSTANCQSGEYNVSASLSSATDLEGATITLTAIWRPIKFSVVYANGGGSGNGPTSPMGCVYGDDCDAPANTYTAPSGKHFSHWACSSESNTSCASATYNAGASINNASSVDGDTITLTAVWATSDVSLKLNKNGGTGTIKNNVGEIVTGGGSIGMRCTPGATTAMPTWASAATANNTTNITNGTGSNAKVFLGWSTSSTATTGSFSITCPSSDGGYYAVWGTPTCNVTHGTGTVATTVDNKPTCTVTCSTGYHTSGTYSGTAGTTTYSYTCEPNSYTITLNDSTNGGTGGSGSLYTVYDTNVYLDSGHTQIMRTTGPSITIPTKAASSGNYYVYTGYYSAASGTATQYIARQGYITQEGIDAGKGYTSNQTWYARFGTCSCTPGNNATCAVTGVNSSNQCTYSYTCTAGYNNGGSTSGTFTGVAGVASNDGPSCGTGNTITIKYSNGGYGNTAPIDSSCVYGENFTTANGITGVTGYTFNKWSVNGNQFNANASVACTNANLGVTSGQATLTATWTANSITCDAGKYLEADDATCKACPAGKYCSGGTFTYNGNDQGITGNVDAGYYAVSGCKVKNPTTSSNYISGGSCGVIAAGRYGSAGATSAQGAGPVAAGYFSTGGATKSNPSSTDCVNSNTCGVCSSGYSTGGATAATCTACRTGYSATGTAYTNHDNVNDCKTTITLNKNGGSGTIQGTSGTGNASVTCSQDTACNFGNTSTLSLDGYTFKGGWGTSSSCTATTTSFTNPTGTYYACKAGNEITLMYSNGGHGTPPANGSCTYGGSFTTPAAITENGYTFDKWTVNNQEFAPNTSVACTSEKLGVTSGSATITATWKYTASFSCNRQVRNATDHWYSGTAPNEITNIAMGQSITLPSNPCKVMDYPDTTNPEYEWFDHDDGLYWVAYWEDENNQTLSAFVLPGHSWTWNANQNLIFKPSGYVSEFMWYYNCGTGSGTAPAQDTITINNRNVSRPAANTCSAPGNGYSFAGWRAERSGQPSVILQPGQYGSSNLWPYTSWGVFDAEWQATTYTISYDLNDISSSSNPSHTGTKPTTYTVETPTFTISNPTMAGYTFTGWTVTTAPTWANGSSSSGATNFTVAQGTYGNIAFKANWTPNTYTVTLNNANATTNGTATLYTKYNTGVYKDSAYINSMTTSANPITKPVRSYTVTYNANGGTVTPTSATATYTFDGYYSANSNGTQYIGSNGYITADGLNAAKGYTNNNQTWYTRWTGGTVTLPTPTWTGHTFTGWYTAATGGTKVADASPFFAPTANITLYAHWTMSTYNLTWSCGDGTGTPSGASFPSSITYGDTLTFPANTVCSVPAGHTFTGWVIDAHSSTGVHAANSTYTWDITSGSTIYAHYEPVKVNITYSCGTGATGTAPSAQTGINYGSSVTLSALGSCAKAGHSATKWVVSGTSDKYDIGSTVQHWNYTENKTLTPNWSANTYTITYELNGGTQATSGVPNSYTYGVGATINGVPTMLNSNFGGWCETESLTNCSDTKTISSTATGNKTFYAKWSCKPGYTTYSQQTLAMYPFGSGTAVNYPAGSCAPDLIHITCHGNGGRVCMEDFTNWHFATFYDTRFVVYSEFQMMTESPLFAANTDFEPIFYNPTGMGGDLCTIIDSGLSYYNNHTFSDYLDALATKYNSTWGREHYTFDGLWTTQDNSGIKYLAPDTSLSILLPTNDTGRYLTTTFTSNGDIYAHWIPDVYKITLNNNGGTGGYSEVYEKYEANPGFSRTNFGDTITSVDKPTKTGHTFAGYYDAQTGGNVKIPASGVLPASNTFGSATTLYAHWTPNTYTVTYDCGTGATGNAPANGTATYGVAFNAATNTCAKAGNTFAGWKPDGETNTWTNGTTWTYTSNKTFTATWTVNKYIITFNPGSNVTTTGTSAVQEWYSHGYSLYSPGGSMSQQWTLMSIDLPTKNGFVFAGYYDNPSFTGTPVMTNDTLPANTYFTADTTLYAKWTASTYDINYVMNGGQMINSEYTQLEYLQSNGTQYINITGLNDNDGDLVATAVFTPTTLTLASGTYGTIFGRNSHFQAAYTSAGKAQIGNAASSGVFFSANTQATVSGVLSSSSVGKLYVNGSDTGLKRTFGASQTILLFAANTSGTMYSATGKLYSFIVTRNGNEIMHLVPARRNSDNALGMYDMIGGGFYTKGAGDVFGAGADIAPLPTNYVYGTTTNIVGKPIRSNSSFVGWCENSGLTTNCVTPQSISSTTTGDKTFYAKWTCNAGYTSNTAGTACVANTITLTWANGGHGTAPTTPASCTYGSSFKTPTISATGYTFNNWKVGTKTHTANTNIICNQDNLGVTSGTATLTAQWTANSNTITLSKNGGTGTIKNNAGTTYTGETNGTMTCTTGSSVALPTWASAASANNTTNITKGTGADSKIFLGWATTNNATSGSFNYACGTASAQTLYAVWGTPTCSITNGTGTVATSSANKPTCAVTCNTGYHTSGTYSGTAGTTSHSYACAANTFNVAYAAGDGGTGSAPSTPTSCTYNGTCNAPSNTGYTKAHATFVNWGCTASSGSCASSTYAVGASISKATTVNGATITLTARWNCDTGYTLNSSTKACDANTYNISYVLNGGAYGSAHPETATYDTQFTVNNPTHAHGTFAGWNITDMSSGTHTIGGSSVSGTSATGVTATTFKNLHSTQGATVTFTAKWTCAAGYSGDNCTANTNTITLSKNGGTGTIKNNAGATATGTNSGTMTCTTGSSVALPTWASAASANNTTNITKGTSTDSKIFLGWATTNNATSGSFNYVCGTASAQTLYAVWGTPTCSITNGTGTVATSSANKPTCAVTCDCGYKTSGTYSGTAGTTSYSYTCTANTITFDWENGGHGTAPSSPASCTYDGTFTMPAAMTATGYTFAKWNTGGTSTTQFNANQANVACTKANLGVCSGTATVTGSWTANTYTVKYNANKPSVASHSVSGTTANSAHTYNVAKNLTANGYSLTGWTFKGWATTATGEKEYDDEQSVINLTSANGATVNLYAVWAPNHYRVILNDAGGSGSQVASDSTLGLFERYDNCYIAAQVLNNTEFEASECITSIYTRPTKQGYIFDGYYTEQDGQGSKVIEADGTVTGATNLFLADSTIYAKWNANTYNITYNLKGGSEPTGNNASDFMPVEYIQGSGASYIDTGVVPTINTGVRMRAALTTIKSSDNIILGATNATAFAGGNPLSIDIFSTRTLLPHGGSGSSYAGNQVSITNTVNTVYDYKINYMNSGKASVNTTEVNLGAVTGMTTKSLHVFNLNTSTGGTSQYATNGARVYGLVLTEGATVLRNYIPVRQISTNKCGLYDTINNTFITTQTSTPVQCPTKSARPTSVDYDEIFNVVHPARPHSTFAGWNITNMDTTNHYHGVSSSNMTSFNTTTLGPTMSTYYKNLHATSGTVNFTATWTCEAGYSSNAAGTACVASTYTITYNLNDISSLSNPAHGTNHPGTYTTEQTVNISNPTMTGYTFSGWTVTTAPTSWGAGSSASGATNFKIAAGTYGNIAFKATWTANNYSITLNDTLNGGTGGSGTIYTTYETNVYKDSARILPMTASANGVTVPTKASSGNNHYVFTGYFNSASGSSKYIGATGFITDSGLSAGKGYSANKTWYAQFGTCACTPGANVASCSATGVSSNKCVYTYTCNNGYHAGSTGTTQTGTFTASTAGVGSNTSPNCSLIDYTMRYSCGVGGTVADGSYTDAGTPGVTGTSTVHYGDSKTMGAAGTCHREFVNPNNHADDCADCFDFNGWTVRAESTALEDLILHNVGANVSPWGRTSNTDWCIIDNTSEACDGFADTDFYVVAQYTPKHYDVTYMYSTGPANNNPHMPTSYTYTTGDTIRNADQTPPAHATFNGWCNQPNGGGTCWEEGQPIQIRPRDHDDMMLYAQWSCDTGYTLGYDNNDQPVCNANTITCEAGYYLSGDSATCEPCLVDNYCEGGTFTYNGTDQGLKVCATEIATGWHSLGGTTATSKKACFYQITLHKNGYSGTINADAGVGCKVAATATTTNNATLRLFYNTACTLPTFSGFSQTGYTNSGAWSATNTIDATTVTTIAAVTATPTTTTYYVTKPSCAANYYKNNSTTCTACSTLGGHLYIKSAAGNKTNNTVCYVDIPTTSGKYIVNNTDTNLTTCPAGSYCAGGKIYWPNVGNISACPTGYTDGGAGLYAQNQCKTTCGAGQCLPTAGGQCTNAGAGNWSAGGVVAYGSTLACNACASGLTTIGYGHGADEAGDCGRILHVGTNHVYLRSDKKTTPSLNVKIGNTTFYGNMSTTQTNMSDGIAQKLKLKYNNTAYSVYDDSAMN